MSVNGRIYKTEEQAQDVMDKLKSGGFGGCSAMITPASAGPELSYRDICNDSVLNGDVPRYQGLVYAAAVNDGKSVVLVDPAIGFGAEAESILEAGKPENPGGFAYMEIGNGTPLSDIFSVPTLSHPDRRQSVWSRAFSPLTRHDFTLSSKFGMGLLSSNPAPLSSKIGYKTLSGNDRPWETSMGMKLLSNNPTPLSSMFGLPLLTRRRTVD